MSSAVMLREVYARLLQRYGELDWWPAETAFEVMVGAILTQNTAWTNVEKAIAELKRESVLDAQAIVALKPEQLAAWIRPAGYFNVKAKRLQNFCRWYLDNGAFDGLDTRSTPQLRDDLLSVNGVGMETADDMLLYAFCRPVFVVDAYTRRIFARIGVVDPVAAYDTIRTDFETALGEDVACYNNYHALIVEHAKQACRKTPRCVDCCVADLCAFNADDEA